MKKRSVTISGHATSVSLEQEFWEELTKLAENNSLSLNQLISDIDKERTISNLSSAIRIHILKEIKKASKDKTNPD